jgi:hypothetical protein
MKIARGMMVAFVLALTLSALGAALWAQDTPIPVPAPPPAAPATAPAATAPAAATQPAGPALVQVSVYIISLGKYDVANGSFTVDFYLDLKHAAGVDPTGFEFMNGRAASTDLMINTPTEQFYRIQANLVSPVDLKRFPFDRQQMQIILEDKNNSIEKQRYVPLTNECALDPAVTFIGWDIKDFGALESEHVYRKWGESYSQFVFDVNIARLGVNAFMKTFLPVFFIVLIVLSSFILGPDQAITRLGMAGSGLVAAVMFHVSISNQIPPVGYLTFADKFMVLTYLVTLLSFLINVVIIAAQRRKQQGLVDRLHHATEVSVFVLVPLAYVLLFVLV